MKLRGCCMAVISPGARRPRQPRTVDLANGSGPAVPSGRGLPDHPQNDPRRAAWPPGPPVDQPPARQGWVVVECFWPIPIQGQRILAMGRAHGALVSINGLTRSTLTSPAAKVSTAPIPRPTLGADSTDATVNSRLMTTPPAV